MDSEACQRLGAAIEEDSFRAAPPVQTHGRQGTVCAAVQAEIFDAQLCGFFRPRLVVLMETWPSQARIVLMSTPARRR